MYMYKNTANLPTTNSNICVLFLPNRGRFPIAIVITALAVYLPVTLSAS